MLHVLGNFTYRQLFLAQVVSLVGTGLATVALGLLAFDLAGADAGLVLGTALTIKMLAYIGLSPMAGVLADILPRRSLLIGADLTRALIAVALPFVDQIWQIYVLIFLLQSASALFTPTFQATIPDILADRSDYTRALSLSRLAYDLESLLSPVLAAALLTVIGFHWLFALTSVGFVISALFVFSTRLPQPGAGGEKTGPFKKAVRGMRIYLKTPRLRGLLALNVSAAAITAMVIVNTVVIVRSLLGRPDSDVAIVLAAFGAGSMLSALTLPRLLDRLEDRIVMLSGAGLASVAMAPCAFLFGAEPGVIWAVLPAAWFVSGVGYSCMITPSGRLLQRSAHPPDRPAIYAAQFSLSHVCWLVTYPLAGWLGSAAGMGPAAGALALLGFAGCFIAAMVWPVGDPDIIEHQHLDLDPRHPHLREHAAAGHTHTHEFVIDELHVRWPTAGG